MMGVEFAEVWQHSFPVPAGIAEFFPGIKGGLGGVDHLHLEDGTAASEDLSSLLGEDSIIETCLGHCLQTPIIVGIIVHAKCETGSHDQGIILSV